jgi:chemotaxis protein MotB
MALRVKGMIPEDDSRVAQIGHPAPPWLINYADLMTEMVCFFVILYALSGAFSKPMQKANQDVKKMIEEGKIQGEAKIDKEGMRITLEEKSRVAFFESGKAELTEAMRSQMDTLAPVLRDLSDKFDIVVEGHTDDVPIYTKQFASNWELSTARATNVVKLLLEKNFNPKRLAAVGYGDNHLVVPNNSDVNRKKNRRVVFFIKNTPYPDAKPENGAGGKEGKKITVSEGSPVATEVAVPAGEQPAAENAAAPPAPAAEGQ